MGEGYHVPTLMLRGISRDLMDRIAAYASRWGVGRAEAAVRLMTAGADHLDARSAGAAATNAVSADERRERARRAATARWADRD